MEERDQLGALCLQGPLSPHLKSQSGKSRPPELARLRFDHREDVFEGRSVDCNGFYCKLYLLLVSNS